MHRFGSIVLAIGLLGASAPTAVPGAPPADPRDGLRPVVGEFGNTLVEPEDTLLDVAFRNRLGFEAVSRLNPEVDVWIPDPGTVVRLPTRYVLPDIPPDGLVVNVPEMRLYDFTREDRPEVFSIAIGDPDDPTPVGVFRVGNKRRDPFWNVPASIREEKPHLPPVVRPGPENPLGDRWMTIGATSYGIHGTNNRWSIGRMATHGCVRLYEDEMRRLFERVAPGTTLRLIYQPFKWGREGDTIYLEAHPDVYHQVPDAFDTAIGTPERLGILPWLDLGRVRAAVDEARGVPVPVGRVPRAPSLEATSRPPS